MRNSVGDERGQRGAGATSIPKGLTPGLPLTGIVRGENYLPGDGARILRKGGR